jgi:hypothetical protein
MRIDNKSTAAASACRGQVMSEFLLITALVAIVLLIPLDNGRSVSAILLDALLGKIRAFTTWLAII